MKKDISVEELKMIQLKILDSIDDFCKKNGIQYFLFSGTLIGAVRHKGYIPWDDDVDICMKRKDYDRFFSEFNQQRRDTLKAISAEIEKNYYLASGKVIDTATVIEEENNCAIFIIKSGHLPGKYKIIRFFFSGCFTDAPAGICHFFKHISGI